MFLNLYNVAKLATGVVTLTKVLNTTVMFENSQTACIE